MTEVFDYNEENPKARFSLDELVALPHEALAAYAYDQQEMATSARTLLSSLARLQQDRELAHETEIIELEMFAEKDALTGLLNKRAWLDRLESFIADEEQHFGILFIDLSRFKLVNDHFDHVRGDEILKKTAEIIDHSLRQEADYITYDSGRYGGDEFAILCDLEPREDSNHEPVERLEIISSRLQENFNRMVTQENLGFLHIDAAIGFALYEEGMTAEDLLRQADKAMYIDKYARTIDLSKEETVRLKSVKHILDKAGVRIPEGILNDEA